MTSQHQPDPQPEQQPEQQPETVTIRIRPTATPASELPMGLVYDVTQVLRVHGLDVREAGEHAELLMSLVRIVDAVAIERGGRRQS